MQIKEFLSEERAVSPVIGVILMVAITVILAAVIGTFVLGLGQNVQSSPSASFTFDFDEPSSGKVTVTHTGGDKISSDNAASLTVNGSSTGGIASFSLPVSAGDSVNGNYSSGETVRVIWVSKSGDSTATLGSQEAPS